MDPLLQLRKRQARLPGGLAVDEAGQAVREDVRGQRNLVLVIRGRAEAGLERRNIAKEPLLGRAPSHGEDRPDRQPVERVEARDLPAEKRERTWDSPWARK